MKDATILLMPGEDGYRAAVGALVLDTPSLTGFGTKLESLLRDHFGNEELDVEYVLSRDLNPKFPACARCEGTKEIELDGIDPQYIANEFAAIDFTKRPKGTCPICKGLGVQIANFWTEPVSA